MAFIDCVYKSKILGMNISMKVILPYDETDESEKECETAVLYLLHGMRGDSSSWIRSSSIERYVRGKNIAVIMPEAHNGFYTKTKTGHDYLAYCGEEIEDIIEKLFGIKSKRENTYIAGLSMGGYGAFRIAFEYPEKFCYAASFSGVVDIVKVCSIEGTDDNTRRDYINAFGDEGAKEGSRDDLLYLAKEVSKGSVKPILRQYCGRQDFLYDINKGAKAIFEKLGYDYRYSEADGDHTWDYWDKCIKIVVDEIEDINKRVGREGTVL